jgi:hypothetical protein
MSQSFAGQLRQFDSILTVRCLDLMAKPGAWPTAATFIPIAMMHPAMMARAGKAKDL